MYEPLLYFYLFLHVYVCMHGCIVCVHACVCARLYEEARGSCQVSSSVAFAFIYDAGSLAEHKALKFSYSNLPLSPGVPCLCLSNTGLKGRPVIPTDFSHGFWVCGCWSSCSSKHFIHQTISQPFCCVLQHQKAIVPYCDTAIFRCELGVSGS